MATAGDSAGNVYAARKNAKKLGARAYLLKSELDKELLGTIRAVHNAK
jgi:DNA-binding NarL/FixJ family response regulator